MFRRWWNYIKSWFGVKSEEMMDPEIQIEAAINEAREQDARLRTEAAKVIAHRTKVADDVEDYAQEVAESKELAKQALLKADAAAKMGNAAEAGRWTQGAPAIALRLQAAQKNLDSMRNQLVTADQQATQAKEAVHTNAMRLQEVAAKRMEMLGQLESAKMQETVNDAMASINATVGGDAPSLKEIEDKIENRMAEAQAKTELTASTPEGAIAELEADVNLASANSALDDLRVELGLGPAPELGSASDDSGEGTSATGTSSPGAGTSTGSPTPPARDPYDDPHGDTGTGTAAPPSSP
jgi:phage shock protein A